MLNVNPERMRYQKNALSFWLCLLAITFNVAAFIVPYSELSLLPDTLIGIDIIINIVFMLAIFMGSEKSKAYVLEWGYALIGVGIFQALRILIVPLVFLIKGTFPISGFILASLFFLASGVSLVFAGLVCLTRSKILRAYLKSVEESEKSGPTH